MRDSCCCNSTNQNKNKTEKEQKNVSGVWAPHLWDQTWGKIKSKQIVTKRNETKGSLTSKTKWKCNVSVLEFNSNNQISAKRALGSFLLLSCFFLILKYTSFWWLTLNICRDFISTELYLQSSECVLESITKGTLCLRFFKCLHSLRLLVLIIVTCNKENLRLNVKTFRWPKLVTLLSQCSTNVRN